MRRRSCRSTQMNSQICYRSRTASRLQMPVRTTSEFLIGVFRFFGSIIDKLPSRRFLMTRSDLFANRSGAVRGYWSHHSFQLATDSHRRQNRTRSRGGKYGRSQAERSRSIDGDSDCGTVQQVLPPDVLHVVPGRGPMAGPGTGGRPAGKDGFIHWIDESGLRRGSDGRRPHRPRAT